MSICATLEAVSAAGTYGSSVLRDLATLVGGVDALVALNDDPLAADPGDPCVGVPGEHAADADQPGWLVALHASLAGVPAWLLGDEGRIIANRVIARLGGVTNRAIVTQPTDRLMAALVWLVLAGNGDLGRRRGQLTAKFLWQQFGVRDSADLGRRLWRCLGFAWVDPGATFWIGGGVRSVWLGDPSLLTRRMRRLICAARDAHVKLALDEQERFADEAAIHPLDEDFVRVRAVPVTPAWAARTALDDGRHVLLSAVEHPDTDVEVFAFSIPDAYRLVASIQSALAASATPP